ncbi:MAG TPA: hypothetical protein VI895_05020 [Bdellovibrionota bacterium]|nr:hypothetical protein [Bdellovibrionota bacterium]
MRKWFRILTAMVFFAWPSLSMCATPDEDAIQATLGDFFQIYVLRKDHRSSEDQVTVRSAGAGRYSAEISYWRSLKSRDPVEEICNAYKWIFFGRGTYGKGAPKAFERFSNLDEIQLRFFDIEFTTKLGTKRAEILPSEKVIPYLKIGVKRSSLEKKKPNWSEIQSELSKGRCANIGDQYLDTKWLNEAYIRQGK